MPDATTFAELFGGVFPTEEQTELGVVYGPLGDDLVGTLRSETLSQAEVLAAVNNITTVIAENPPIVNLAILPGEGRAPERNDMTELIVYELEEIIQSLSVYQNDGVTPYDLSGKTLQLVFERANGVDVYIYENEELSVAGEQNNSLSFQYVQTITATLGTRNWTLWSLEPKTLILTGTLEVRKAANANNS
jgi:hypothetical protein